MFAAPSKDFAGAHDSAAVEIHLGRLWGLWDFMINFQISGVCHLIDVLRQEQTVREQMISTFGSPTSMAVVLMGEDAKRFNTSDSDKERFRGMLQYATRCADTLQLQGVHDRVEIFSSKMRFDLSNHDCLAELRALREAFVSGINYVCFYHYPRDRSLLLQRFQGDWSVQIAAFPASKEDAHAGIDCYALGHNTASVFHFMRVAEIGLRALARERRITLPKNKPIEWGTWNDIIKELRAEIELFNRKRAGPTKDEALSFYNGALAHLDAFKDKYRNMVMHVRASYDEHQAASAMMHVREFMAGLAAKTNESGKRITWRF